MQLLTVVFSNQWFVNNVMAVDIHVELEVMKIKFHPVYNRDKQLVASWRASRPVFAKICEHGDVIAQNINHWLSQ